MAPPTKIEKPEIVGAGPRSLPGESEKLKSDRAIQETNGSSIVSKRSVERLYFPTERSADPSLSNTHYFKYFVKKPQRRSPVINRGYWLRMEAIHYEVKRFLASDDTKRKVIVNLGCGYDPLPFQYLSKSSTPSRATFVDVDYPDLMKVKVDTVKTTNELRTVVGPAHELATQHKTVLFASHSYFAIGCDLSNVATLESALTNCGLLNEDSDFLFIAEVSLTYMDTTAADRVIEWASTIGHQSDFVLLEQILPAGPDHPFARTMLAHFKRLTTPIKSVYKYPTVSHQSKRFLDCGYKAVACCDLYDFWLSSVTPDEKVRIAAIEDFDEWEEFILFGQHYITLRASTCMNASVVACSSAIDAPTERRQFSVHKDPLLRRRWGAAAGEGGEFVYFGGLSSSTRLGTSLLITSARRPDRAFALRACPSARMCHTMVNIGNRILLTGGRTSPAVPLSDAWILDLSKDTWHRVADMPNPRSRHSMVNIGNGKALVYGGNMTLAEPSQWLIYDIKTDEWTSLRTEGVEIPVRMSATFYWINKHAVVAGGFDAAGNILDDCYQCTLDLPEGRILITRFDIKPAVRQALSCAGAQTLVVGDLLFIVGGVKKDGIMLMNESVKVVDYKTFDVSLLLPQSYEQYPLLVGFSLQFDTDTNTILIIGGGGVCFSFGAYWNELVLIASESQGDKWRVVEESRLSSNTKAVIDAQSAPRTEIPVVSPAVVGDWARIHQDSTPVLVRSADIGPCTVKWTPEYLVSKLGEREIVVHQSQASSMNFQKKNFEYKTMRFDDFMNRICSTDQKLYLRSLSAENPKSKPADIYDDFPEIAGDFRLPRSLKEFIGSRSFSSPLRISSPDVGMWLHYDVTANVLVQVRGKKRVRLYPPSAVTNLSFPPGASSSTIENVFEHEDSQLQVQEAVMEEGDVLFIPAMWLHATVPLEPSISVNTFWKDLDASAYSAGRDVYGNRDLKAYEDGRVLIKRISKSFESLPDDIRRFYLSRLVDELRDCI